MMTAAQDREPAEYDRVERAIRFLEENFRRQPGLAEVAAHSGLSEFHFQRVFSRWVGISPKRFLQYQTIEHARQALERSRSVLEATYEAGLTSAGRMHDLFVTVDAVTPGEYKRQGAGLEISYGFHESPFGECLVARTTRGVCGLWFVQAGGRPGTIALLERSWPGAVLRESRGETAMIARRIFANVTGDTAAAPLGVVLKGTNFQLKVWEALLRIPSGTAVCYEHIAAHIGAPRAMRAVGSAVGANPVAFVIPCHRVIRKLGDFGEYAEGALRKQAILGWEAARLEQARD